MLVGPGHMHLAASLLSRPVSFCLVLSRFVSSCLVAVANTVRPEALSTAFATRHPPDETKVPEAGGGSERKQKEKRKKKARASFHVELRQIDRFLLLICHMTTKKDIRSQRKI